MEEIKPVYDCTMKFFPQNTQQKNFGLNSIARAVGQSKKGSPTRGANLEEKMPPRGVKTRSKNEALGRTLVRRARMDKKKKRDAG
jgi:hypothetical protein